MLDVCPGDDKSPNTIEVLVYCSPKDNCPKKTEFRMKPKVRMPGVRLTFVRMSHFLNEICLNETFIQRDICTNKNCPNDTFLPPSPIMDCHPTIAVIKPWTAT
jgi:hypothetical protein